MKESKLKTNAWLISHVKKLWKNFKNGNDRGTVIIDLQLAVMVVIRFKGWGENQIPIPFALHWYK